MDVTLLAALSVLIGAFTIIAGFISKLWWDEWDAKRRAAALLAMGLDAKEGKRRGARTEAEGVRSNRARQRPSSPEESGGGQEGPATFTQSDVEDSDDDGEQASSRFADKKIGKKKLAKLQAKAEAKAQREQEQVERQERKRQEELKAKKEEEERRLEELEELKRKEKLRAEQEEKKRKDQAEYDMLKVSFAVEEQGYDQMEEDESENIMRAFIDHITKMKVAYIDELASLFRLSSEDVVKRLEMLLDEKLLSGVFDDRGKFIYISADEMLAVAKFINQRGRVSVRELADYSNRLISLEAVKE